MAGIISWEKQHSDTEPDIFGLPLEHIRTLVIIID